MYLIFDTETTGLDPKKAQLLSLGAVEVHQETIRVDRSLELTAFAPHTEIRDQVAIHGITRQDLRQGVDEVEMMKHWFGFIGNAVLVAHHTAFDLAMLNQISQKLFRIKHKNISLDTAHLARRLEHGTTLPEYIKAEDYSLDRLCERYAILPEDRHTAAGDALITAQLLLKLLAKARKSSINTYGELIR